MLQGNGQQDDAPEAFDGAVIAAMATGGAEVGEQIKNREKVAEAASQLDRTSGCLWNAFCVTTGSFQKNGYSLTGHSALGGLRFLADPKDGSYNSRMK